MELRINPAGRCLALVARSRQLSAAVSVLGSLGTASGRRAAYLDVDASGRWRVDLGPSGGPTLGPFPDRPAAVAAEVQWLEDNLQNLQQ